MIRATLFLLLFGCARLAVAAPGQILSITVLPNGREADVVTEGFQPLASYQMGYTGVNRPTAATPSITVTSPGYTGITPVTKTRTVYLQGVARKVYPDIDVKNESTANGNLVTRYVLSDYLYSEDRAAGNSRLSAPAGWVTNTAGAGQQSLSISGLVVTNNSTQVYQPAIGNWAGMVEWERLTGPTFRLRCWGFQGDAENGQPLAAVRGIITDGTHTESAVTTQMVIDPAQPDELPTPEWIIDVPSTTLTQGAECTANIEFYPMYGTAKTVVSSSAGPAGPTPLLGPVKFLCDKNGTYERSLAVVNPAAPDDASGKVVNMADYATVALAEAAATPFKTMGKAAHEIAAYNLAHYSRNDAGAGEIHRMAGRYAWLGFSGTFGDTPKCRIIIKNCTGVTRDQVIIDSQSGSGDISDRISVEDCVIATDANNMFTHIGDIVFKRCKFDAGGILLNSENAVFSFIQCEIPRLTQGIRSPSVYNCVPKLVRGCNLDGFDGGIMTYTVAGNRGSRMGKTRIFDSLTGQLSPPSRAVIFNNRFLGLSADGSSPVQLGNNAGNTAGLAFIQNVVEAVTASDRNHPTAGLAAFGTSDFSYSNYIIWNNTLVGNRCFVGYNDAGTVFYSREFFDMENNYWGRWATKQDEVVPGNPNRTGGWSIQNSVKRRGDYAAQAYFSLPGNFYAEMNGVESWEPDEESEGFSGEAKFVSYKGALESGDNDVLAGAGGGDYHIAAGSPLIGLTSHYTIPFAQDGKPRTPGNNAAGAFVFSSPTNLEAWRLAAFGTAANTGNAADEADPDHDGVSNFIEFAMNLNPSQSTAPPVSAALAGGSIEYIYSRSKAALQDGLTFTVEWSSSPGTPPWSTAGVTETLLTDDGTTQQIKALVPTGNTTRRFVRLRVTAP